LLCGHFPFKGIGRPIDQCGMQSLAVIEAHDIICHIVDGFWMIRIISSPHPLHFQIQKEPFHDRIIPTIAFPAHALLPLNVADIPDGHPGCLGPSDATDPAAVCDATCALWVEGHLPCLDTERGPHVVVNGPAHHLAGEQIDNDRDIQPALS
jgi:hypothetical protein